MEKKSPKEVFDRFRSMRAILKINESDCKIVQICGFIKNCFIVGYVGENEGIIKDFTESSNIHIFDRGTPSKSFDIVGMDMLEFIDIHAKYKD